MTSQLTGTPVAVTSARLSSAAATGIAFGVFTLWLQGVLPGNWNVLANSGAVWTVVAIATAALLGTSTGLSAGAGVLALVGEVAGYYWCAAPWHDISVTRDEQLLWTAAALVVGPVAGVVGHGIARGTATHRVVACLAMAGVIVGEGMYARRYVPDHHLAATVEIVVGASVAVIALFASDAAPALRAGAAVIGALVAIAVVLLYVNPVLL